MRRLAIILPLITSFGIGGCGDNVQGQLRLLLAPPHEGRNPSRDPFALVDQVEIGQVEASGRFVRWGSSSPNARFGPGLVGVQEQGAPYVLGLNDRGRPVASGFGPFLLLNSGVDEIVTVPFSPTDLGVATKLPFQDRTLADPFAGRAPSLFVDHRNLEDGAIDGPEDLTALATAMWEDDDLLLQIRVTDDQVSAASDGEEITAGDAVRVYIDNLVVTAGADGRVELAPGVQDSEVTIVSGGYQVRMVLPVQTVGKNRLVPFDLRVFDKDGEGPLSMATWMFDPRRQGGEPQLEDYGHLVLGVPLLDVLHEKGPRSRFPGPDGLVEIEGTWNADGLVISVRVPDDDVKTSGNMSMDDRVEFWFDLANATPPGADPVRFVKITGSAGSSEEHAGGWDPLDLHPEHFVFTGAVQGTISSGEYEMVLTLPWSDLQLLATPQRGWFLGAEIRVVDEDAGKTTTMAWSYESELDSDRWPELRLFSVE